MPAAFYIANDKGVRLFEAGSLEACLMRVRFMNGNLKIYRSEDGILMASKKPIDPSWRKEANRRLRAMLATEKPDDPFSKSA